MLGEENREENKKEKQGGRKEEYDKTRNRKERRTKITLVNPVRPSWSS